MAEYLRFETYHKSAGRSDPSPFTSRACPSTMLTTSAHSLTGKTLCACLCFLPLTVALVAAAVATAAEDGTHLPQRKVCVYEGRVMSAGHRFKADQCTTCRCPRKGGQVNYDNELLSWKCRLGPYHCMSHHTHARETNLCKATSWVVLQRTASVANAW